jgi:hypothetical protein
MFTVNYNCVCSPPTTVGRYPAQKFGFNPILLGDGVPALLKKGIVEIGD